MCRSRLAACALALAATGPVNAQAVSAEAAASAEAASAASAPAGFSTASVQQGRRAYTSTCARCHGLNLVVSGSAFYDLRMFPSDAKDRFVRSVNKGLRAMPAWEGILKLEDIDSIWLYLGSVNGWPKP